MGQMGHTDPATFSRHYHAGVPRAQAKSFGRFVRRDSSLAMSFNSSSRGLPKFLRKESSQPCEARFARARDFIPIAFWQSRPSLLSPLTHQDELRWVDLVA